MSRRNASRNMCPLFARQVQNSVLYGELCILSENLAVSNIRRSCSPHDKTSKGDRCMLTVPFGGKFLTIDVLWNLHTPHLSPDFIFSDQEFMDLFTIEEYYENVPSLQKWEPNDDWSLCCILQEFMETYRSHHFEQLDDDSSLKEEIQMLLEVLPLNLESVEVMVNLAENTVCLVIRLPIDVFEDDDLSFRPGSTALLLAFPHVFRGISYARLVKTDLVLSSSLREILGVSHLAAPSYASCSGLVDYVISVIHLINSKRMKKTAARETRKVLMTELFDVLGKYMVDYDWRFYREMRLYFEKEEVKVVIPDEFPVKAPELWVKNKRLDFPYSKESSFKEIAEEILKSLFP